MSKAYYRLRAASYGCEQLLASGNWVSATVFLYHFCVPELAERLLKTIRKQEMIKPGDRVAIAVSGGADSVALLLLLLELRKELGIVLSVAHVNHKLRGEESDGDSQFVAELARQNGLELHASEAPLPDEPPAGLEATARQLRYDIFRRLLREGLASKIATAHTIDDQAETVLLRALRGTGVRGLAGIRPRLMVQEGIQTVGEIVRPLLGFRRSEVEAYLKDRSQAWREDSSNRNLSFLRNRVRHRVLPLLKEDFGQGAVDNLADLAEIARAEEEHWDSWHGEVCADVGRLPVVPLLQLPLAAQRRLIRNWLQDNVADARITFRLIEELRELAWAPVGKQVELAERQAVRRVNLGLMVEPDSAGAANYEYPVSIPGQTEIAELGLRIEILKADRGTLSESTREQWLDPELLPKNLTVRNWRAGDRFWPAHTKAAKKVKELLAERHLTGLERKRWPVIVAEGIGVVWMRGFPAPAALRPAAESAQVLSVQVQPMAAPR